MLTLQAIMFQKGKFSKDMAHRWIKRRGYTLVQLICITGSYSIEKLLITINGEKYYLVCGLFLALRSVEINRANVNIRLMDTNFSHMFVFNFY